MMLRFLMLSGALLGLCSWTLINQFESIKADSDRHIEIVNFRSGSSLTLPPSRFRPIAQPDTYIVSKFFPTSDHAIFVSPYGIYRQDNENSSATIAQIMGVDDKAFRVQQGTKFNDLIVYSDYAPKQQRLVTVENRVGFKTTDNDFLKKHFPESQILYETWVVEYMLNGEVIETPLLEAVTSNPPLYNAPPKFLEEQKNYREVRIHNNQVHLLGTEKNTIICDVLQNEGSSETLVLGERHEKSNTLFKFDQGSEDIYLITNDAKKKQN
jgi:hypothetical protein